MGKSFSLSVTRSRGGAGACLGAAAALTLVGVGIVIYSGSSNIALTLNLPGTQFDELALNPLETESPLRAYYDRWGGPGRYYFSSLDSNNYPRRTDWANPTRFDEMVTGRRYLDNREDPPQRIVEGRSGLGLYGGRLGYGSFQ